MSQPSTSSGVSQQFAGAPPDASPSSRSRHTPESSQRRESILRSFLLLEEPQSPALSGDETWGGMSSSPSRALTYDEDRRRISPPSYKGGMHEQHLGATTDATQLGSSPPGLPKNTRGSRLGQQMGRQKSGGGPSSGGGYTSQRTSMAFSSSDDGSGRDSQVDEAGRYGAIRSRPPPLGPAFGVDNGGAEDSPTSSTSSSATPQNLSIASKQQRRTSRLQYNKVGDSSGSSNTSRFEDRDRAARLAQGSLGSMFTSSPYQRRSDHGNDAESSSSARAQRELFLPAMKNGGGGAGPPSATGSRPTSPSVPIKAPRRMTSAQRLRSAREDLQGSLADSSMGMTRQSSGSGMEVTPPTSAARSSFSWTSPTSDGHRQTPRSMATTSSTHSQTHSSTKAPMAASALPRSEGLSGQSQLSDAEIVTLGAIDGQDPISLLPANGGALSSKNVLTIALAKAQNAVQHDSSNAVPEAIQAYSQAVRLLQEVMDRISPRAGSSRKSNREEERRRLRVIHDTYADRIRLLSMIYNTDSSRETEDMDDSLVVAPSHSSEVGEPEGQEPTASAPVISIQQESGAPQDEEDAAAAMSPGGGEKERMRSDSEGSFRSIDSRDGRRSAGSAAVAGATPRPSNELAPPRSSEDLPPLPSTPYFDASPTLSQKEKMEGENTIDGLSTPLASRFASSASALPQVGATSEPLMRSSLTLPRLERQEGLLLPNPPKSARPFGDGDSELLPSAGGPSAFLRSSSPLGTGSTRPRATTLSAANHSGKATLLVNNAVDQGSLVSRRRAEASMDQQATPQQVATRRGGEALARQSSRDSSGGSGNVDADGGAAASGRKRAISQPGSRRPILPSAFQAPPLPKFARKMSIPSLSSAFNAAGQAQQQQQQQQPQQPQQQLEKTATANAKAVHHQASSSLSPSAATSLQQQQRPPGSAAYRFPSPAPSFTSGYHALLDTGAANSPAVVPAEYPWTSTGPGSAPPAQGNATKPRPTAAVMVPPPDLFPSGLASANALGTASFHLDRPTRAPRRVLGVLPAALHPEAFLPDLVQFPSPPERQLPALRPFIAARSLRSSIATGAFLTRKLCVTPPTWRTVAGVKLVGLEVKVRAMDAVCSGVEAVARSGEAMLAIGGDVTGQQQGQGTAAIVASAFAKQLEDFDALCYEVQGTLAKKIGFIDDPNSSSLPAASGPLSAGGSSSFASGKPESAGGKKSGFQSKFFTRSFLADRVAAAKDKAGSAGANGITAAGAGGGAASSVTAAGGGVGDGSTMAFVEGVARMLGKLQILEAHLEACLAPLATSGAASPSALTENGPALHSAAVTMYNATRRGSTSPDAVHPYPSSPGDAPPIPMLPLELRRLIEAKLRRSSDFLANVLLRFVLRDLALLLDKAVKRTGGGGGLLD
ncbi:hypothetical protein BDZ90DRAFT_231150 [Jaminaea rosea]|uniref:MIT domain-containing protein n=1 Tax=Jaminaea rosea TaxID=1569628 RepID=A0A316UVA0_9BASI|nr:hypothetical protein BDZ90DRAFT_231150 [Jaminaea rosea]PWN29152.1 hypothetical protein BDZ90DRAFT_231150 [Jaminaea rosea]